MIVFSFLFVLPKKTPPSPSTRARSTSANFESDTTVVSALRSDGTARPRAAHTLGVAVEAARRRKEGRYPELVGVGGGSRRPLESPKISSAKSPGHVREGRNQSSRAEQAWRIRWGSICVVARAVVSLGLPRALSADGDTPLVGFCCVTRARHFCLTDESPSVVCKKEMDHRGWSPEGWGKG